jgi:flagellar biosynthetic protein FliS
MDDKLAAYREADTLSKSQIDLIVQVYDGAIAALKAAGVSYRNGDMQAGYEQLQRAKRFVTHLYTTLDPEAGGTVKLYAFVINQTNIAEATKDLSVIDDNITILNNVRLGWLELKTRAAAERTATGSADKTRGQFAGSA